MIYLHLIFAEVQNGVVTHKALIHNIENYQGKDVDIVMLYWSRTWFESSLQEWKLSRANITNSSGHYYMERESNGCFKNTGRQAREKNHPSILGYTMNMPFSNRILIKYFHLSPIIYIWNKTLLWKPLESIDNIKYRTPSPPRISASVLRSWNYSGVIVP